MRASTGQSIPAGCVAQYKMGFVPADATKLQDHVGVNHGTITGATYDGVDGLSFTLTAPGDFVNCGKDSSLIVTNLSVEAWVNIETLGATDETIVSRRENGAKRVWQFFVNNTGGLSVAIGSGNGLASATQAVKNAVIGENTWYHVGFVFTDGSGVTDLYVDGVAQVLDTDTQTYTSLNETEPNLIIGAISNGAEAYWDGWIRKLRIYNTALTARDFALLYEQGAY